MSRSFNATIYYGFPIDTSKMKVPTALGEKAPYLYEILPARFEPLSHNIGVVEQSGPGESMEFIGVELAGVHDFLRCLPFKCLGEDGVKPTHQQMEEVLAVYQWFQENFPEAIAEPKGRSGVEPMLYLAGSVT